MPRRASRNRVTRLWRAQQDKKRALGLVKYRKSDVGHPRYGGGRRKNRVYEKVPHEVPEPLASIIETQDANRFSISIADKLTQDKTKLLELVLNTDKALANYIPEFELHELDHPQSPYSPEVKVTVCMYWAVLGSDSEVAKITNVPREVILRWRQGARWWPETLDKCKIIKNQELEAKFTGIMDHAVEQLGERLVKGDVAFTKQGKKVYKPISGRDLAGIMAIVFDKRALLRGDPTSRSERVNADTKLEKLAKMLKANASIREGTVIEDGKPTKTYIEVTTENNDEEQPE